MLTSASSCAAAALGCMGPAHPEGSFHAIGGTVHSNWHDYTCYPLLQLHNPQLQTLPLNNPTQNRLGSIMASS
jgi:hypothetical protein